MTLLIIASVLLLASTTVHAAPTAWTVSGTLTGNDAPTTATVLGSYTFDASAPNFFYNFMMDVTNDNIVRAALNVSFNDLDLLTCQSDVCRWDKIVGDYQYSYYMQVEVGSPALFHHHFQIGGSYVSPYPGGLPYSATNPQLYGTPIPEPSTGLLLGSGLMGLWVCRKVKELVQ